jgi:16S rRNA (cytidine1402-2'-O)-methyltransferase
MKRDRDDDHQTKTDRSYSLGAAPLAAPALAPGLHIVATPIGHLGDMTLRGLQTLAAADVIACEDTRVSRKLLDHYGIRTPLWSYHEHNAAQMRPKILARLAQGGSVALISDAGTPLISDPGYKLVREAREAGQSVSAAPGASSVLTALAIAGLPTDRFFFEGFLPAKAVGRRERIATLARIPATLVLFETGPRLAATLADLAQGCGPREAAVCRELTKLHEEVRRADLNMLAQHYGDAAAPKGEIVIAIAPPSEAAPSSEEEIDSLLREALATNSVKDAVAAVASASGAPRKDVYRRALDIAKERNDGAEG